MSIISLQNHYNDGFCEPESTRESNELVLSDCPASHSSLELKQFAVSPTRPFASPPICIDWNHGPIGDRTLASPYAAYGHPSPP